MSGTLTRQRRVVRAPALPHLVGLDGLRAVAVIAVVLYHADVPWMPGGFLGVDVFFVLSGFLITSLLLVELDRTGRVDFRRFYLRRARRLLPALFVVLAATALLVAWLAQDAAAGFRRDLPGALLYYSNWLSIATETSYFEFIGRPPMLKHLWSLAVEEQFYILWPAVALLAYRVRGARAVGLVALGGALVSTIAMVAGSLMWQMPAPMDPSRLYFGTDTHAMGILIGAALAVVWRPGRTSPVLPRGPRLIVGLSGAAALGLLVWAFLTLGEYSTFLYRGGFLLVAVISAVVVAAASHRGVAFGRWLGMRPMRWIGQRSYGIYLWHWPLFLITRPGQDLPVEGAAALALRIGLLLVISDASYRFLEMPIRSGALGRWWRRVRYGRRRWPTPVVASAASLAVLAVVATGYRIWTAPQPQSSTSSSVLPAPPFPMERELIRREAGRVVDTRPRATAFGDSVMLGASGALERGALAVEVNARVAAQAAQVLEMIRTRVAGGALESLVVLHVGNNGIITERQIRAMLSELSTAGRVVLVNSQVPRPWMRPNNTLFAQVVSDYPNVVLADWASASDGHGEYFVRDGVHLTSAGALAYEALIAWAAGVGVGQP